MAGAIRLGDLRIILRALNDILDHQADRGAGGAPLEHAREDANLIGLAALRGEPRGARPALVEPRLQIGLGERKPRRTSADTSAQRGAGDLAPGREPEDTAEGDEYQRAVPPNTTN